MRTNRWISLLLSLCLLFALTACANRNSTSENNATAGNADTQQSGDHQQTPKNTEGTDEGAPDAAIVSDEPGLEDQTASGSRILVVYFSCTGEQYEVGVIDKGNTAIVADMIIDATGADRFEILPADVIYPNTYDELTDYAKQEQRDKARPAIKGELPDLSQYDTIFIGAPVWWGDWPMICYTYFEANDFSGKTLIPFSTHAGSGLSGFDKKLSGAAPGATVETGLAIRGSDAQNNREKVRSDIDSWLAKLGF